MYEKRLKELSNKIGSEQKKEFYILTHKNKREIYFQNNNRAIKFLDNKLNSNLKRFRRIKRIIYILIKTNFLQPFLKKIKLPDIFGDVVYFAGQIKSFDLKNKIVYSFPSEKSLNKSFIEKKKIRNEISKKGFAPRIFEINEKIPYSKEELLKEYMGGRDIEIFKKSLKFYKSEGIKKVQLKNYVKNLKRKLREKAIKNDCLKSILGKLSKLDNNKILVTTCHGDFAKENVLINKKGDVIFIDWEPRKGVLVEDLINYFRGEVDLLEHKNFLKILKRVFPKEVQKNIGTYIILSEINSIIRFGKIKKISLERIKKYSFFLSKF